MTSVGATTGVPETSASFSSGGFSNFFGTPSYQVAVVDAYLTKLGNTNAGKFNRSGRAIPDIAANGFPTAVVINQNFTLSGGTSASTPIVAAMIAAVNDARLAAGKSPVGFINPAVSADGRAEIRGTDS